MIRTNEKFDQDHLHWSVQIRGEQNLDWSLVFRFEDIYNPALSVEFILIYFAASVFQDQGASG
jgi:hypothetical protein